MLAEGTSMPEELIARLKMEYIVSLVLYLCHEDSEENGEVYECGGGVYQKVMISRGKGWAADLTRGDPSPEDIQSHIDEINDMDNSEVIDFMEGMSELAYLQYLIRGTL